MVLDRFSRDCFGIRLFHLPERTRPSRQVVSIASWITKIQPAGRIALDAWRLESSRIQNTTSRIAGRRRHLRKYGYPRFEFRPL